MFALQIFKYSASYILLIVPGEDEFHLFTYILGGVIPDRSNVAFWLSISIVAMESDGSFIWLYLLYHALTIVVS